MFKTHNTNHGSNPLQEVGVEVEVEVITTKTREIKLEILLNL